MLRVSIYRYNPDTDSDPYYMDYSIETGGKDLMVLDVLNLVKEQDPTLSYRRSCREGVCGSDGINMNGKNGLACITPLSEVVRGGKLQLKPLLRRRWLHALRHWRLRHLRTRLLLLHVRPQGQTTTDTFQAMKVANAAKTLGGKRGYDQKIHTILA